MRSAKQIEAQNSQCSQEVKLIKRSNTTLGVNICITVDLIPVKSGG